MELERRLARTDRDTARSREVASGVRDLSRKHGDGWKIKVDYRAGAPKYEAVRATTGPAGRTLHELARAMQAKRYGLRRP